MAMNIQDVTETRHDTTKPILDHTHSLARRIGLAQLPLACIVARFLQDVWTRFLGQHHFSPGGQVRILAGGFGCLLLLKVLTGIVLAGWSAEHRINEETKKAQAKDLEDRLKIKQQRNRDRSPSISQYMLSANNRRRSRGNTHDFEILGSIASLATPQSPLRSPACGAKYCT